MQVKDIRRRVFNRDHAILRSVLSSMFLLAGESASSRLIIGPCGAMEFGSLSGKESTRTLSEYAASHCSGTIVLFLQCFSASRTLLRVSRSPVAGSLNMASLPLLNASPAYIFDNMRASYAAIEFTDMMTQLEAAAAKGIDALRDAGSFEVYALRYTARGSSNCGARLDSFDITADVLGDDETVEYSSTVRFSIDMACQSSNLPVELRGLLLAGSLLTAALTFSLAVMFWRLWDTYTLRTSQPYFTFLIFFFTLVSLVHPLLIGLQVAGSSNLCIMHSFFHAFALSVLTVFIIKGFRVFNLLMHSHKGTARMRHQRLSQRGMFLLLFLFGVIFGAIFIVSIVLAKPTIYTVPGVDFSPPYFHCQDLISIAVFKFGARAFIYLSGCYVAIMTYNVNRYVFSSFIDFILNFFDVEYCTIVQQCWGELARQRGY